MPGRYYENNLENKSPENSQIMAKFYCKGAR